MSVPEGTLVDFTPTVTNNTTGGDTLRAPGDLTLTGLSDATVGNLDGLGTCMLPQTIPAGGSYSCTYPAPAVGGGGGVYIAMVTATGNIVGTTTTVTASGQVTVTVTAPVPTLRGWGLLALALALLALAATALRRRRQDRGGI